jgi:hypothetical protein
VNLPVALDFLALSLLLYFYCTAEREEGKLWVRLRAAFLHNALIGRLWLTGGFFTRLYYKKVLCKN